MNCVICGTRPPADGWTTCTRCADRLDDDLAAIVTLTHAAADHLTPTAKPGAGGSGKPGSRPPLDLGALDDAMAADALPVLEEWERAWRQHRGMTPYGPVSLWRARGGVVAPDATLNGVVGFLRAQLALMVEDVDWPIEEVAREVREQRGLLARHDDDRQPDNASRIPCPGDGPDADGRLCGWRLTFTIGAVDAVVVCPNCGVHWTTSRLLIVGLANPDVTIWAYPDDVEATTGVKGATLRQWVKRGHIPKQGNRYDIGAVYRRVNGYVSEVAEP